MSFLGTRKSITVIRNSKLVNVYRYRQYKWISTEYGPCNPFTEISWVKYIHFSLIDDTLWRRRILSKVYRNPFLLLCFFHYTISMTTRISFIVLFVVYQSIHFIKICLFCNLFACMVIRTHAWRFARMHGMVIMTE